MQLNWTVITILVVTFFAVNGLFKGWWREAVTTFMLVLLLFLLQQPGMATQLVALLNTALNALLGVFSQLFGSYLTLNTATIQLSADDSQTWIVILFVVLGSASLLSRLMLRSGFYTVNPIGHVLGLGLGGFNGFFVLNLLREYLDGRSLPGNVAQAAAASASTGDITIVSSSTLSQPAATVSMQAVDLPNFTLMDSFIPWLVIGFGLFLLLAMVRTRLRLESNPSEGQRITYHPPYGYRKTG